MYSLVSVCVCFDVCVHSHFMALDILIVFSISFSSFTLHAACLIPTSDIGKMLFYQPSINYLFLQQHSFLFYEWGQNVSAYSYRLYGVASEIQLQQRQIRC